MRVLARPLFAALALMLPATGCRLHDVELGTPDLEVDLSLDRTADGSTRYGVGEAMIAELTIRNKGENQVSIPMPTIHTTELFKRPLSSSDSLHVEFLDFAQDAPEFVTIDPGDELTRPLVLPRATADAGDYSFFAVYKSELAEEIEGFLPFVSNVIEVSIQPPVLIQRDAEGRIIRPEALAAVRAFFAPRTPERIDAQLIFDTNFRAYVWWCSAHFSEPDAEGRMVRSCFVNAYLGHIQAMTEEVVPTT